MNYEQQQSIIMLVTCISNSLTYPSMLAEKLKVKPFATIITESLTVWSTYSWEKLGTAMQTSLPSHLSSLGNRITNSTHITGIIHMAALWLCMKSYGCEARGWIIIWMWSWVYGLFIMKSELAIEGYQKWLITMLRLPRSGFWVFPFCGCRPPHTILEWLDDDLQHAWKWMYKQVWNLCHASK